MRSFLYNILYTLRVVIYKFLAEFGDIHRVAVVIYTIFQIVVNVDLLRKSSIQICNLEIFFLQIYLYSSFLDGRLP